MSDDLTREEFAAISALRRVARRWPESLWLFSASGTLWVMKKDRAGRRRIAADGEGMAGAVVSIAIESDGGDW